MHEHPILQKGRQPVHHNMFYPSKIVGFHPIKPHGSTDSSNFPPICLSFALARVLPRRPA